MKNFVAGNILSSRPAAEWLKEINEAHKRLKNTSSIQAKVAYLEVVKKLPFYGASFYSVQHKGFWSHPDHVSLAVTHEGISVLHPKSRALLLSWPYKKLERFEYSAQELTLIIRPDAAIDNPKFNEEEEDKDDWEKMIFLTSFAEEIVLIAKEHDVQRDASRAVSFFFSLVFIWIKSA